MKTKVEFANGITGVVGPNGCGKTNVLDSLRWVLGEQRISILRGEKMEDVIFSGTRELKPLGMAEVSLEIVNDRNVLPTEYRTLTITRRLHRSGESEYLLNKVPCRLKDITDLFADTGMGPHAYSAIELAMVESILSDKADQRRMLFEEAAGITKYKSRKKAAMRKLEATDQDLLRLTDILQEVSTQVSSLDRQMRKAERYRQLDDRIKHITLVLLKNSYRQISDELQQVANARKTSDLRLAALKAQIDKWELNREDLLSQSLELFRKMRELRTQMDAAQSNCHHMESEISVAEERLNSAKESDIVDRREIEAIDQKLSQLATEKIRLEEKQEAIDRERERALQRAEESERLLHQKVDLLERERKSVQDQQRDLFETEGRKNLVDQSQSELSRQITELQQELDYLGRRSAELHATKAGTERQAGEQLSQQAKWNDDIVQVETRIAELRSRLEKCESEAAAVEKNLAECRLEARSLETHLSLQEQMIVRYEGYGDSVAAVFANLSVISGVIDTVANLLQADEPYRAAIEAALGDAAEYIVVRDHEAADQAIAYLNNNRLGRATFLVFSELAHLGSTLDLSFVKEMEGFVGQAVDVVATAPEHHPIVDALLGDVVVASDRDAARRMLVRVSEEFQVVTLDGYCFRSRAVCEGGSEKISTLLGRGQDLDKLKYRLGDAHSLLTSLDLDLSIRQDEKKSLQQSLTDELTRIEELRSKVAELRLDQTRTELEHRQIGQELQEVEERIGAIGGRLNEAESKLQRLREDARLLAEDATGKQSALKTQGSRIEELERESFVAGKEHEELRLKAMRLETELGSLAQNKQRTEDLVEELGAQRGRRAEQLLSRQTTAKEAEHKLADNRELLGAEREKHEQLKSQEEDLTVHQGNLNEKQGEFEQLLRVARKDREQALEEEQGFLVQETERKGRFDEICRQLHESFAVEASQLTIPEPMAEQAINELESELSESRRRQEQLGMVNMLALEEYEREAERERFLRHQIEDLTAAKENLKTTITRINATARRMFLETFLQVRTNFQGVFQELFQGGDADLRLEDDADPLESPVIISARPRGKRLLNISQLSGGEKALTAISLLFGIYLVKPSPFCILDEVDAPLDDANIGRFLKMVRTFSERTQFIIITHNKKTMEQCSRLYGVTMAQPGVSQIVSVDFERKGRKAGLEVLKYEEPEPQSDSSTAAEETHEEVTATPEQEAESTPRLVFADTNTDQETESDSKN